MVADYALMVRNLLAFYDFTGKTMVSIGAGGGQFVRYGHALRKIMAIDRDSSALHQLREAVDKHNLSDKFEFILGDFLTMNLPVRGDVVLFEFCLHEMKDVALALSQAGQMAADVVVFDHGLSSQWAYHVAEEMKVRLLWKSLKRFKLVRHQEFADEQKFRDHAELLAKVQSQGKLAIQRAEKFKAQIDISIPMTYELALVQFT
jgi:hypothetical protein